MWNRVRSCRWRLATVSWRCGLAAIWMAEDGRETEGVGVSVWFV